MADESKGVAYAILGIVAVIAVVGLVLLFKGMSGGVVAANYAPKVYGGGEIAHGMDQYQNGGFVRYSDGRVYAGASYVYPERIKDTGGAPVPVPTYDSDPKRTGPIIENPCPYPPYSARVRAIDAASRECIRSGENPDMASEGRIPAGFEDFYCCTVQ